MGGTPLLTHTLLTARVRDVLWAGRHTVDGLAGVAKACGQTAATCGPGTAAAGCTVRERHEALCLTRTWVASCCHCAATDACKDLGNDGVSTLGGRRRPRT